MRPNHLESFLHMVPVFFLSITPTDVPIFFHGFQFHMIQRTRKFKFVSCSCVLKIQFSKNKNDLNGNGMNDCSMSKMWGSSVILRTPYIYNLGNSG